MEVGVSLRLQLVLHQYYSYYWAVLVKVTELFAKAFVPVVLGRFQTYFVGIFCKKKNLIFRNRKIKVHKLCNLLVWICGFEKVVIRSIHPTNNLLST